MAEVFVTYVRTLPRNITGVPIDVAALRFLPYKGFDVSTRKIPQQKHRLGPYLHI